MNKLTLVAIILIFIINNQNFTQPPPVYPGYLYTYDAAGNRIKKEYNAAIEFRKGSEEETTQKLLDCTVKVLPNPTKGWLEVTIVEPHISSKSSINIKYTYFNSQY
jgi:hypothetical protein